MALLTVEELKATLGVGELYETATLEQVVDAATNLIEQYVTTASFAEEPAPMKEAALALAVSIFQTRTATGGQIVGADFSPSPFRLGRSLFSTVAGLLAPYVSEGVYFG